MSNDIKHIKNRNIEDNSHQKGNSNFDGNIDVSRITVL